MLCESCGKNVATVTITEIINDQKKEVHLCEDCAQEKGLLTPHFSLPALLGKLVEFMPLPDTVHDVACPNCGLKFSEFRKHGRLGCPQDYYVFKEALAPLLQKIHGSVQHNGKVPKAQSQAITLQGKIIQLRQDLAKAVEKEEYEKAAVIRDKIKELEKNSKVTN